MGFFFSHKILKFVSPNNLITKMLPISMFHHLPNLYFKLFENCFKKYPNLR
ncbi:hypothetical protein BVAVS116_E0016 (plasmid) [Borreliella valaisiana VS116]|uniref:Uncharacterized protein n=1 Tax=Borreliella valaisiana VS116 TaxID=445987 RepID=C0R8P7_BORVA|nr:hypothetical protein BVAVS116_E0016 [Borreliella valaisiana VS116]